MLDKLAKALDYVNQKHIEEAVLLPGKRKRKQYFRYAVAAVLALVLIGQIGYIPMAVSAEAVALAPGSKVEPRPDRDDYENYEDFRPVSDAWWAARDLRFENAAQALSSAVPFFRDGTKEFLGGTEENVLWSPVNAYIGLSMLAETTAGETQQQLLDLLGAENLEQLRSWTGAIWETTYEDDGNEICLLANSLWLDEDLAYVQQTMDNVANYHYASVYRGNFGTSRTDKAIQTWLTNNTGGMLKKQAGEVSYPADTVLALASTIYFQAKWSDEFSASRNTQDVFHAPGGDVNATYMNKKEAQMTYYWGDSFGAVRLPLKNGSSMWFFLPDEGKTVAEVLREGQYMQMLADSGEEQDAYSKYMKVNLSVPKFDVTSSKNLKDGLQQLGVTDVFQMGTADFSPAIENQQVFVSAVNQAVRVQIDEQGVKAAAYIEIPGAGAAMPPEEIIDFVLDRPFLFIVTSNSLPLFAGVVNEP